MFEKLIKERSLSIVILGVLAIAGIALGMGEIVLLVAGGLLTFINPDSK
jgi:hypothetical protein